MRFGRRNGAARGGVLIEFCIVVPVLLVLLLGAIDWGWYFMVREVATNAVREGARTGSVAPNATAARVDAVSAAQGYLGNTLGAGAIQAPSVAQGACAVAGYQCITVSLTDYPVTPGRPTASITGLGAWTHVPTRLTVQAQMRLEIQP